MNLALGFYVVGVEWHGAPPRQAGHRAFPLCLGRSDGGRTDRKELGPRRFTSIPGDTW